MSTSKEPIHLFIEMQESETVKQLREEISSLRELLGAERLRLNRLEDVYGYEVRLNNELVDLCKLNDIPFRDALDRAKREREKE